MKNSRFEFEELITAGIVSGIIPMLAAVILIHLLGVVLL